MLNYPLGLAFDSTSGLLYISEWDAHRIAVMNPATGSIVRTIGKGKGSGLGELNRPYGVALDGNGNILVVDCANARVVVFNAGNGTLITAFQTPPSQGPVIVDSKGTVVLGGSESISAW